MGATEAVEPVLPLQRRLPATAAAAHLHDRTHGFYLSECSVLVSCQDAEGRAPIHVAISNQHSVIIQLLISHPDIRLNIRDRQGMTPFACAMTHKNNKAAEAIIKREPGAAEQVLLRGSPLWGQKLPPALTSTSVSSQVDNKGRNFLHVAVQNSDIESVLFLISVQANVNSRVQDAAKLSPLHLAVQAGSEIIVRNLVPVSLFSWRLCWKAQPDQSGSGALPSD